MVTELLVIFYFFSSRLFDNDFRRPLIEALVAKGHEAWHVRIGQQIILTGPHSDRREFNGIFGLVSLIGHIRAHLKIRKSCPVFVDTTGGFVPTRSLLLGRRFAAYGASTFSTIYCIIFVVFFASNGT